MPTEIIVAGITLIGTLGGSFLGVAHSTKLTSFRLDRLEEKVDKHNNFMVRLAVVEGDLKAVHKIID